MLLDVLPRAFAWTMCRAGRRHDELLRDRKQILLGDILGAVLEIGPGAGVNLRYYKRGVRWIGFEPNRYMHSYLKQEADTLGMAVDLRQHAAEHMDVETGSADFVVSTLVLCSVPNPHDTLCEIRRVLKPGGQFIFVEHVVAEPGTRLRRVQRTIRPLWRCIAGGCHPDRDTLAAIRLAGFQEIQAEQTRFPLGPIAPHILGRAIR